MRISIFLLAIACLPFGTAAQEQLTRRSGNTLIFQSGFETRRDLRQWRNRPSRRWSRRIKTDSGTHYLRVRSIDNGTHLLQFSLPVNEVAGRKLHVRLRLRVPLMEPYAASYHGAKVMLHIAGPSGDFYPQLRMPPGAHDWQSAGFTAVIPADASTCTLVAGIEAASGEVLFDDINVSVFPAEETGAGVAELPDVAPPLRGTMISTTAAREDLQALAVLGANHVRWQLTWNGFPDSPADTASLNSYEAWLQGTLAHLYSLMPLCDSLGLKVVIDLHTLPGGRRIDVPGQEHRIFSERKFQSAFRNTWQDIARKFKYAPALWGYDLANEPIEGYLPDSLPDWQGLAIATAMDIRRIDSLRHIIVEGAPNGSPDALPGLMALPDFANAVYSFHMYEPTLFTHQGLYGLDTGIQYPGTIAGRYWDSTALRAMLQPVREWQLRHSATIYVGEFSAVRWAPDSSAYRYLRDCISIFEEWGWSWAYHAFRESQVWSVEHDGNRNNEQPVPYPTDRKLLLIEAFKKNSPR